MKKRISALLLTLIMTVSYVSPAVYAVELADDIIIDNITETEIQETVEEDDVILEADTEISDTEQQELTTDETVTEDVTDEDETVTEDTPAADETVTENIPAVNETVTEDAQNSTAASEDDIIDQDSCGDTVDWTLYKDGKLVISGMGNMYLVGSAGLYSYSSRSSEIKEVVIEDGITSVGNYAFSAFPNLEKVTIADSVTSIGEEAFSECTSLATIVMPASLSSIGNLAFANCEKLENISLGNALTSIGDNAFIGCASLKSITIPEGVTAIPDYAFDSCTSLESVSIPQNLKVIGKNAFYKCSSLKEIILPSSLTAIMDEAFYGCTGITSVTIPDSLVSLGEGIFKECTSLESVTLSAALESIGSECFNGCTSLKSITLPETVTVISRAAFANCSALKTVNMPAALEFIGAEAFLNCVALRSDINIPQGVTEINDSTFENCKFITTVTMTDNVTSIGTSAFSDCVALKDITMSGSLTSVGDYAFYGCSRLDAVNLPDSITSIGDYTFYECNDLTEFVMPANLTSIGSHCFDGCTKIKSILLPESVTTIGSGAFANCSALESINLPAGLTSLDDKVFYCCAALEEITIPDSIKAIGNETFENCVSLSKIVLPANLEKIGNSSFSGCKKISEFILPETVTEIGEYALAECYSISKLVIPESITEIKTGTFFDCYSLENIELPETLTAIGNKAFIGCSSLKEIEIPENVTTIGNNAFTNCEKLEYVIFAEHSKLNHIGSYAFMSCSSLKEIEIPDEVTEIEEGTFDGCVALETAILPENLTDLGEYSFALCASLKEVDIPDGVTEIKESTFDGCTALASVELPENLTTIGERSFAECTSLRNLTIPKTVTRIANSAFECTEDTLTIAVVKGSFAEKYFKDKGFSNIEEFGIIIDDTTVEFNSTANLPEVTKYPESSTSEIDIVWEIEDTSIAVIENDENGNAIGIKAVGVGETVLKATDNFSGYTTTAAINVVLPEDVNITLSTDTEIESVGLQEDDTRTFEVKFILNEVEYVIPNEKLTFTSSNEKAAKVDENGILTAMWAGTGTAKTTVTAVLKNDSTKSAAFAVKAIAKQVNLIKIYPEIPEEYQDIIKVETFEDTLTPLVIIPKELMASGNLPINIKAVSVDNDGNETAANVKWTTDASAVATVAATKAAKGQAASDVWGLAKITVKKNAKANGIAVITATANDLKKTTSTIEIDVRDYTPRLESNTVTLNTFKTSGTGVRLYTAYDAFLQDYTAAMAMLLAEDTQVIDVNLSGKGAENFYAVYDSENGYVVFNADNVVKNGTYKLNLNILTAEGETTQVVTIKVANKLPKVTIKQAAPFELFYKYKTADIAITAKDPVNTKEDAAITAVTMQESDTFAATAYNTDTDSITVSYADPANPLSKFVNGKTADTKVNLVVEFDGYREAYTQKNWTLKSKETKVTLGQSKTSTKYTALGNDNTPINVINTKTKEVLDLTDYTVVPQAASAGYVTVEKDGTKLTIKPILNGDSKFEVNGKVTTSHSAKIDVQHSNWLRPITISHSFNINTSVPTVKLKATTLKLNSAYDTTAQTVVTANLDNCPAPVWTVEPQPTSKQTVEEFAKLNVTADGWNVSAGLADMSDVPANGNYKYKLVADMNGVQLKEVYLTVNVTRTLPTVKLKATTLKLNSAFDAVVSTPVTVTPADAPALVWTAEPQPTKTQTVEEFAKLSVHVAEGMATAQFTDVNNVPAKGSYKYKLVADMNGVQLKEIYLTVTVAETLPSVTLAKTSARLNRLTNEDVVIATPFKVTKGYEATDVTIANSKGNAATAEDIKVTYDKETGVLTAQVLNKDLKNGSYKYDITPTVKLEGEEYSKETQLKKAAIFTVTVFNGVPSVTYSAKGKIDLVNRGTGITYTLTKGTNFVYNANDVATGEFKLVGTDADKFNLTYLGTNAKGQHMVEVKANADAKLNKGGKYSYNISANIDGIIGAVTMAKEVRVSPSQSTLKLAVKGNTTIYQSYKGEYSFNVNVTSPIDAEIATIQPIAKGTTVPFNALDITVSQNTDGSWKVSYKVKRASRVKVNKTYRLALEITPVGNGENVKPQVLNVNLKVKR